MLGVLRTGGAETEVGGLGHAAAAMLRGFSQRIAAREDARAGEVHEWTDLPIKDGEAYCIDTREGRLVRVPSDGTWILFMYWTGHEGRVLTRGRRSHVERYAQEVLSYGPPGGPAYQGEALAWKQAGEDATLHAVTVGGEFRLMPLRDGGHLLLFARNDYTVFVLAMGERDALMRDAEYHLLDFRGDGLRVRLGDGKVDMHGLGAGSVVAYLELMHDARLVLGHLGGGTFGLFHTRGTGHTCVRLYSLAELRRGDLGCTLEWTLSGAESTAVTPADQRAPELARTMSPSEESIPTVAAPTGRPLRQAVSLEAGDLRAVQHHLACTEASGPGATVVPRILEGLRVLAALGEGDHVLRASELLRLLAGPARVHVHCCSKTLARSLAAVASRTPLLRREGRRWRLRLGELRIEGSELLASIKAEFPEANGRAPNVPSALTADAMNDTLPVAARHAPAGESFNDPSQRAHTAGEDRGTDPRESPDAPGNQQRRVSPDGQPLLWRSRSSRLSEDEAASRWTGRKPRGPPRS